MSIMTDIRDRLMESGDKEAAEALDHACFAARDRLDALDEMRKGLAAKDARISALEAALGEAGEAQETPKDNFSVNDTQEL